MKRKLPRISSPQPQPSPALPLRSRDSTHLPSLSPHPSVPQLTAQHHSPLSAFYPTSFPSLTITNHPHYPTLKVSLTSSSSIPSKPSTIRPIHRGSPSCYPSTCIHKRPPRPPFLILWTLVLADAPTIPTRPDDSQISSQRDGFLLVGQSGAVQKFRECGLAVP